MHVQEYYIISICNVTCICVELTSIYDSSNPSALRKVEWYDRVARCIFTGTCTLYVFNVSYSFIGLRVDLVKLKSLSSKLVLWLCLATRISMFHLDKVNIPGVRYLFLPYTLSRTYTCYWSECVKSISTTSGELFPELVFAFWESHVFITSAGECPKKSHRVRLAYRRGCVQTCFREYSWYTTLISMFWP